MKRKTEDAFTEKRAAGNRWVSGAEGFTLIELLIGICILSFGLLAIGTMQISSLKGVGSAGNQTEAVIWAQGVIDELMLLPTTNANLSIGAHPQGGNPPVTANVNALAAGYTPAWDVTNAAQAGALSIVLTVSWTDRSGARSVQLVNVKPSL